MATGTVVGGGVSPQVKSKTLNKSEWFAANATKDLQYSKTDLGLSASDKILAISVHGATDSMYMQFWSYTFADDLLKIHWINGITGSSTTNKINIDILYI